MFCCTSNRAAQAAVARNATSAGAPSGPRNSGGIAVDGVDLTIAQPSIAGMTGKEEILEALIASLGLEKFINQAGVRRKKPSQTVRALSDLYDPERISSTKPHFKYTGSKVELSALVDELARQFFSLQKQIRMINEELSNCLSRDLSSRHTLSSAFCELKLSGNSGEVTPVSQLKEELNSEFTPRDWNSYEIASVLRDGLSRESIFKRLSLSETAALSTESLEGLKGAIFDLGQALGSYTFESEGNAAAGSQQEEESKSESIDTPAFLARERFSQLQKNLSSDRVTKLSLKVSNLALICNRVREATSAYLRDRDALVQFETLRLDPHTQGSVRSLVSVYTESFPRTFDSRK